MYGRVLKEYKKAMANLKTACLPVFLKEQRFVGCECEVTCEKRKVEPSIQIASAGKALNLSLVSHCY